MMEWKLTQRIDKDAMAAAHRHVDAAATLLGPACAPITEVRQGDAAGAILDAAATAGATRAGYIVLRLPHAVKDVFLQWLDDHAPTKKNRIVDRIRELRGGQLNVSEWGTRLKGEGIFADQIRALFRATTRRAGALSLGAGVATIGTGAPSCRWVGAACALDKPEWFRGGMSIERAERPLARGDGAEGLTSSSQVNIGKYPFNELCVQLLKKGSTRSLRL